MREELAVAAAAVASCASPSAWSWSDGELVEGLDVLHRMAQQVAAAQSTSGAGWSRPSGGRMSGGSSR